VRNRKSFQYGNAFSGEIDLDISWLIEGLAEFCPMDIATED
jgi:hypothetical protein